MKVNYQVARFKVNMQNSVIVLYTSNKEVENEISNIHLQQHQKKSQNISNRQTKHMKGLHPKTRKYC